jgi:ParB family chromosome partitioning protein
MFNSEFNCRGDFTYESVSELAESIKQYKLQIPIVLWPRSDLPDGKKYMLVCGHRRYRAHELLREKTIFSLIRPDLDERKAKVINLIENIERNDLNVLQEAQALKRMYPIGGSLRTIAKELNQSERWVHQRLRLLELPLDIQHMFASDRLPLHYIDKLYKIAKQRGAPAAIEAAKAIEKARDPEGTRMVRTKKLPEYLRPRKLRPTQTEIIQVITQMLNSSIIGLAPRMGAYCAGFITKEEILEDIQRRVPKWAIRAVEETSDE